MDHARRTRGVLVAAKIDRISRDVIDFASLLRDAEREGWLVLVLDLPMDTTTAAGRMAALNMANVAEFERRIIGERTAAALLAKKQSTGKRLGRPRQMADAIRNRIILDRAGGKTWQAIADGLNADGVPTTRGGRGWQVGTVQAAHRAGWRDAIAENRRRLADDEAALAEAHPHLAAAIHREADVIRSAIRAAEVAHEPIPWDVKIALDRGEVVRVGDEDPLISLARAEAHELGAYTTA